jgi:hypothetical protein
MRPSTHHQTKGMTVEPIETVAKPASMPKAGLVAALGALSRVKGSGAFRGGRGSDVSKTGRSLILSILVTVLGVLAFTVAPALAAAPETPETKPVTATTATTATAHGVLDPKAASAELIVEYEFFYAPQGVGCTEAYAAPESPGMATGKKEEKVALGLTGLEPNTDYTVCASVRNPGEEGWTVGNAVPFKTSASKPTIISLSAPTPKAEEARLEATVNPSNESTECHFQYGEALVTEHTVACEQGTPPGTLEGGEQGVSANVTGLKPDTTYHYKVLLKNATGETTKEATFTTAIHPETPTGLKVEAITATTAKLTGILNPKAAGNAGSYEFLYKASAKECEGGEAPGGNASGGKEEAVEAEPTLLPNTTYTVCLRAHNEAGEESTLTAPVTFTTLVAAPKIESESSNVVDATEARLEAEINPGNSETAYHFEYGPSTGSYDVSVPGVSAHIPAGLTTKPVNAAATGLKPGTTYHYRAVAANALPGVVEHGSDQTFTTPAAAPNTGTPGSCTNERLREEQPYGLALPDCRAYEMVSPANTNGTDATAFGAEQAAHASEAKTEEPAITYSAKGSYGNPEGALIENQYLARRTPAGWTTQNITPLASPTTTEDHDSSYPAYFTPELTAGLAVTSAQLGDTPNGGEFGVYLAQFASHTYQYVGVGDVSHVPWGASTGLERVVLTKVGGDGGLVEEVDGTEVPVSITNTGEELAAGAGSPARGSFVDDKDAWHAVSENGSRVYFTTPPSFGAIGQLFVRVNIGELQNTTFGPEGECLEPAKACTIEVSAPAPGVSDPNGPQSARYWGASANGEKVFFTSSAELTADADTGESDNAANLYEYDLATKALTDLTVPTTAEKAEDPDGAAVQGVVQISEEGRYVYFVAKGALAAGASDQQCREETEEEKAGVEPKQTNLDCNLYVSHDGGSPVFIATLAAKDHSDWLNGNPVTPVEIAGPELNTAVVTPNGADLAFVSERSLPTVNFPAGYDNEQAAGGDCEAIQSNQEQESGSCAEVYLYDAASQSLECASCNPSGARPVGPSSLTGVKGNYQSFASYRPRDLLANGALFFNSKDALVQHASGRIKNVYEYQNGAVHAISNVVGGFESFFLDASPNGANVFFASADKLLPEDPGGSTVVWDAREDGGFPVVTLPPTCDNADSCKSPESPQPGVFVPPASSTFSGPGNTTPAAPAVVTPKKKTAAELKAEKLAKALKTCRTKKDKQKRQACEKQARTKYGPAKAKKKTKAKKADSASNDRRASR